MGTALLVSMLFAALLGREGENQEDKSETKILARGVWPVQEEKPVQRVLRNSKELAVALGVDPQDAKERRIRNEATLDTAKLLKVKAIDWDKQMLLVVAAGPQRTGGYCVEIVSVRATDGTMTVTWKLHTPAPGAKVSQAVSYPAQMVLVERFQGTVSFDPTLDKK